MIFTEHYIHRHANKIMENAQKAGGRHIIDLATDVFDRVQMIEQRFAKIGVILTDVDKDTLTDEIEDAVLSKLSEPFCD
jgi:hypothetical protein